MTRRPSLLCDLDGTLVDSLQALRYVHRSFLLARGAEPGIGEFERYNGVPLRDVLVGLKATHSLVGDETDLLVEYETLVDRAYLDVRPAHGAEQLLSWAFDRGWGVAIVTSGRRPRAEAWLDRHGLHRFVHAVIGAEDATPGKPDPAPFTAALAAVAGDASTSWAVEDSEAGYRSATAAGIARVVVVGPGRIPGPRVDRRPDLIAVRALLESTVSTTD